METINNEQIRQKVRERYAGIAKGCCSPGNLNTEPSCCGSLQDSAEKRAVDLGYSKAEISEVPQGANMGLGCGNPTAMATLKPGETVWILAAAEGSTVSSLPPLWEKREE